MPVSRAQKTDPGDFLPMRHVSRLRISGVKSKVPQNSRMRGEKKRGRFVNHVVPSSLSLPPPSFSLSLSLSSFRRVIPSLSLNHTV